MLFNSKCFLLLYLDSKQRDCIKGYAYINTFLYNSDKSMHTHISDIFQYVEAVVFVMDLQLPIQSVPITIKVVSSNPAHGEVYSIQHYVIKFVGDLWQVSSFLRVLRFSSTNKTDRHDIAKILLKVALNTINPPKNPQCTHMYKYISDILQLFRGDNFPSKINLWILFLDKCQFMNLSSFL